MLLRSPRHFALVSIGAALLTMGLKLLAWSLTGSLGLLADAAESLVNLLAAIITTWALGVAARPPDEDHAYGHTKVEYFASGAEGALILIAAFAIVWEAIPHLLHPHALTLVGPGLLVAMLGAAINGGVAFLLMRGSRRFRSVALEADSRHLLTDVWTTVGVIVGVGLVELTGWQILDPLIAIAVAANIIWVSVRLLRDSGLGLLDTALPSEELDTIYSTMIPFEERGISYHALRTRRSASRRFISMHVLVPGTWSVRQGHDICEQIEAALRAQFPETTVFTHLEPQEDPAAFEDQGLDRPHQSPAGA
ncbi:MAG TPA: cation diffusion facilitator family transporter [Ktedonobacterales bacterium]